jgi:hypothetical protein
MFKIDKNIPIPISKTGYSGRYITTLRELEIGDSFFVPLEESGYENLGKLQSALGQTGRNARTGIKTTVRQDKINNGVRCWRTA